MNAVDYRRIYVQAILLNGHHVLMLRLPGQNWELPAGEAEEGELPEDAAIRIMEETAGLSVKVTRTLTREKNVNDTYRIKLTFLVEALSAVSFDPSEQQGPWERDWRSLRSTDLKSRIYDKHLSGKEK